eukprot:1122204-Amphidinium_carterae.2
MEENHNSESRQVRSELTWQFTMSTLKTTWMNQPSLEASDIRNIEDAYVEEDTQFRDNRYPIIPTEDEADEREDYIVTTTSSHCQSGRRETRYYQSHKPSITFWYMQPNQVECRQAFTKQYYRWLEDINRYESENGDIADHVKIATVINDQSLEGAYLSILLKVTNTTTFDEVHGWISNYIYIGVEDDNTVGGIDDQSPPKRPPYKPWWNNRYNKRQGKDKGKGKDKVKGNKARQCNANCFVCGKPGHYATQCWHNHNPSTHNINQPSLHHPQHDHQQSPYNKGEKNTG